MAARGRARGERGRAATTVRVFMMVLLGWGWCVSVHSPSRYRGRSCHCSLVLGRRYRSTPRIRVRTFPGRAHAPRHLGYRSPVSNDAPDGLGRLDDDAEEDAPSDDSPDGAAARGEYDPTEGSPARPRTAAEDLSEEGEDEQPSTDRQQ